MLPGIIGFLWDGAAEKRPTFRPTGSGIVSDFLTRRNGTWHFVRRVPVEFAQYDHRGVVKHSTSKSFPTAPAAARRRSRTRPFRQFK
jgi:hypothetical protein